LVHGNFPGELCRIVATTHVAKIARRITRLYVSKLLVRTALAGPASPPGSLRPDARKAREYCAAPNLAGTALELCITTNMYGKYDFALSFI
jgi:hypothetical protein